MRAFGFLAIGAWTVLWVTFPEHGRAAEAQVETANAEGLAPLLVRLARHAEQFEQMKRRCSFILSGKIEEVDRSGRVDGTKELTYRVIAAPAKSEVELVKFIEDGIDKTAEERTIAEKAKAEKKKGIHISLNLHMPFLASEQARYAFSLAERDARNPNRVRVSFTPHVPAETAYKGSAWVDAAAGEVLTVGFSPSYNPWFVDHIAITMRLDQMTALGRAPSSFSFDARGGFLFLRKHYRGAATITEPRVAF